MRRRVQDEATLDGRFRLTNQRGRQLRRRLRLHEKRFKARLPTLNNSGRWSQEFRLGLAPGWSGSFGRQGPR
jgi:hypothetical protein